MDALLDPVCTQLKLTDGTATCLLGGFRTPQLALCNFSCTFDNFNLIVRLYSGVLSEHYVCNEI
jgi:hypothetical protein